MTDFEIRSRFLSDHASLRGKVSVLRSLALSVLRGDEELASALRRKGQDLQEHLHRHINWEEEHLLPVLDQAESGDVTSQVLLEEHANQRERLAESLVSLERNVSQPRQLAQTIMDLIAWLERDMLVEEHAVLALIGVEPRIESRSGHFMSGVRRD